MPELPEVEIARENLERWLVGRKIVEARSWDRRLLGEQKRRPVERALEGAITKRVLRHGKFLVLDLGRRRPAILAHLGMTGRFDLLFSDETPSRFARVVLTLSRARGARRERVVFSDARRLGAFRLLDDKEQLRLEALGVEPLGDRFTPDVLYSITCTGKRPIKLLLMDQKKIAGIGNIHAAEALYAARIHPKTSASSISRAEAGRLCRAIRRCLATEIERFRAEAVSYVSEGATNHFRVYGREGEKCRRCRTEIARIVQSARSSYYCPNCQPEIEE
jgi:formamidopyrimidine-DNA glycosylase